jgi:hypothetical protein
MDRRSLIKKGAIAGTLVWAAPIATKFAPSALAQYAPVDPPTIAITFPVNGGSYNSVTWLDQITGTAAAVLPKTLTLVEVSIFNGTAYWNGSAFVAGPQLWNSATGTTSWSYAITDAQLPAGSYTVTARATDSGSATATATAAFTRAPVVTTMSFGANADSYVARGSATTNFGTVVEIRVNPHTASGNPTNNHLISFIRFDLSTIPSGATVTAATLSLRRLTGPTSTYDVQRVTTGTGTVPWTEGGITWNNRPQTVTGTATSAAVGSSGAANVAFTGTDLRDDVAAWVANSSVNYGWRLIDAGTGNNTSTFVSKDSPPAIGALPSLSVTYSVA